MLEKPWGSEEILFHGKYTLKRIRVDSGHRSSLHYHVAKHETMYVVEGEATIEIEATPAVYSAGEFVSIPTGAEHRICADRGYDVVVLEAATPQLADVVRVADDYGRAP